MSCLFSIFTFVQNFMLPHLFSSKYSHLNPSVFILRIAYVQKNTIRTITIIQWPTTTTTSWVPPATITTSNGTFGSNSNGPINPNRIVGVSLCDVAFVVFLIYPEKRGARRCELFVVCAVDLERMRDEKRKKGSAKNVYDRHTLPLRSNFVLSSSFFVRFPPSPSTPELEKGEDDDYNILWFYFFLKIEKEDTIINCRLFELISISLLVCDWFWVGDLLRKFLFRLKLQSIEYKDC